tara:strand:+ start:3563 stop:4507 length:945 start_codon:yes stop_codon:yes gene_type:complete
MGIRLLNKYLINNSFIGKKIHFSELSNKKICVDIYNYIYQFLGNNRLIEELEILCKILQKYKIHALFVFDGKYSDKKKTEHVKRRKNREKANEKYELLSLVDNKSKHQEMKLKSLNRDRVKITKWDIHDAKVCLDFCGMKYITAKGEADELCAELLRKKKVFACMSDDTDLFAYGSKHVIKAVNFYNETCVLYNIDEILSFTGMTMNEFQQVCTLSCNDYINSKKTKHFIYYLHHFIKYNMENSGENYLSWLINNNILSEKEYDKYKQVKDIYTLNNNILKGYKYIIIKNDVYLRRKVTQLIKEREKYLKELYE